MGACIFEFPCNLDWWRNIPVLKRGIFLYNWALTSGLNLRVLLSKSRNRNPCVHMKNHSKLGCISSTAFIPLISWGHKGFLILTISLDRNIFLNTCKTLRSNIFLQSVFMEKYQFIIRKNWIKIFCYATILRRAHAEQCNIRGISTNHRSAIISQCHLSYSP